MLTQPFEQPMYYPQYNNTLIGNEDESFYYFGYPSMDPNEDFRASFYNPFEIKHRRRTSRAQLKVLEKSFEENTKPNAAVRRLLAQQLDMTPRGVQIWFQNRRAKAKLQRRKSTEQQQQQQQQSSFFTTNARFVATAAAASCLSTMNENDMFNMPIHPLAPVIEEGPFLMDSKDWRRKSCPSLTLDQKDNFTLSWSSDIVDNRRLTAGDIMMSVVKPELQSDNSECDTPTWTTPNAYSFDMYSGLNYSPMSQQLTPILSTGSPVSLADSTHYDPCLALLDTTSSA